MKKLIIGITLILSVNAYADWRDSWAEAVEKCNFQHYDQAEKLFSDCIKEIECQHDNNNPHVYVDRARLYLLLGNYQEALIDLDKAISNPNLSQKELTRALVSKISAKSNLGITEGVLDDLSAFSASLPAAQELEFTSKQSSLEIHLNANATKILSAIS